ncbi:MAG: fructosamine kinase family protein [Burkholderiales bacterium]
MKSEAGWDAICSRVSDSIGQSFVASRITPVGGGCINSAYHVEDKQHAFFLKLNDVSNLEMFEAEASGLRKSRVLARSAYRRQSAQRRR